MKDSTSKASHSQVPANFEFAALSEAKNYRESLIRLFDPHLQGDVLEVGAGIGQITSLVRRCSRVRSVTALEPDMEFATQFQTAFPEIPLIQGTIRDLPSKACFDAIISVNVLEHIERDLEELAAYASLLKERRGTLCLFVPARPEIYAQIDSDFGHFRRYQKVELQKKLELAGLTVKRLHYFNFIGYFGWWLTFRVCKKRHFDIKTVRIFDRWIFPLGRRLESMVDPPTGQSLVAVAKVALGPVMK